MPRAAETEGHDVLDENELSTSPPHRATIVVTTAARGGLLWLGVAVVLARAGQGQAARRGLLAAAGGMAASHARSPGWSAATGRGPGTCRPGEPCPRRRRPLRSPRNTP
ncbi:hypothetical protein [Amycolatopsis sp. MEPSY49]|uniref:hypothetical protein n=1 Tax=Amycolatopsis sp. MEPSY49 TaxID=3151600 RepID=UPI003EF09C1A